MCFLRKLCKLILPKMKTNMRSIFDRFVWVDEARERAAFTLGRNDRWLRFSKEAQSEILLSHTSGVCVISVEEG